LEIGEEVADLITSHYPDAIQISTKKPHLNLREMIRQDLIESGLKPDHIEAMDECPRCDTRKYFSHRGEDGNTGRFGLIAWWEEI
jgi:copper oxidase (laccase) domain-containing protein